MVTSAECDETAVALVNVTKFSGNPITSAAAIAIARNSILVSDEVEILLNFKSEENNSNVADGDDVGKVVGE